MKKLLLFAAVILSASQLFAQRTIDWTTSEILTPDSLQSASSGTSISLSFVGKNLGTDTVFPGDSVWYQYVVSVGSTLLVRYPSASNPNLFSFKVVTDTIAPNDSMVIDAPTITAGIVFNTSTNVTVGVISHILNRPSANFETGTGLTNNSSSRTVIWWNEQRFPVGSEENLAVNSSKVYPNPVSDRLFVETNYNKLKTINITDITGKVVSTVSGFEATNSIDVTSFSKGLYFYEIKTEAGQVIKAGKFIVQ